MKLQRRVELRHSSGRRYVDTFAAVSPLWTLRAGTLAAGLQAATAGNWLGNIVANGESWAGGPPPTGWTETQTTATRVDSVAEGLGPSGGADNWVLKSVKTGATGDRYTRVDVSVILGAWYNATVRAYSPSANTVLNAAWLRMITQWAPGVYVSTAGEDAWEVILSGVQQASASPAVIRLVTFGVTAGDIAYFDTVTCYRQNTVATLSWGSPNIIVTLDLPQPAAPSVVPFSAIFRYTDILNYWEVRTAPNTAGTDLEIIEVVAGVATVRATADVDWTAGQTDQMRVKVLGASIAVEVNKFGAGAFSAACSYATMATGLTATAHGLAFYGTGLNRITRWESRT